MTPLTGQTYRHKEDIADVSKTNGWCRFCCRIRSVHCRNTRDMDPVDGINNDPVCHEALRKLGGGERGKSTSDSQ